MTRTGYRPQVDGLRCIAILSVVAFHLRVPGLPGGFTGVDVFFVISGYLITGMLLEDLALHQKVGVLDFYARRIRRLLPALTLVIVATLFAGSFLLTPVGEQQDLAASALAASAFVSNVYFWRENAGYFSPDTTSLPLLHTWSLAVEEQFYIIWPLFLASIVAMSRRLRLPIRGSLLAAVTCITMASFAVAWAQGASRPVAAFYLTPARTFEIGIGALVAIALGAAPRGSRGWGRLLSPCGVALVGLGFLLIDSTTSFPGVRMLLPLIGAAFVIVGGEWAPDSPTNRLLSTAPMVLVGKLSYSWYLWHWPMLALARAHGLGEPEPMRDGLLAAASLGLAALTFHFVEQPFRSGILWPFRSTRQSVLSGAGAVAMIALASASLSLVADARVKGDASLQSLVAAQNARYPLPVECDQFRHPYSALGPVAPCLVGDPSTPIRYVVWGDSNAHHYLPAVAAAGVSHGFAALPRTMGGCQPYAPSGDRRAMGNTAIFADDCARFNEDVLSAIRVLGRTGLSGVVLGARWGAPLPWQSQGDAWKDGLRTTVRSLVESGLDVVLVATTPSFAKSVPKCLAHLSVEECGRPRAEVESSRASAHAFLLDLGREFPRVRVWDPVANLCDTNTCAPARRGIILYSDAQHLSVAGALYLQESLQQALPLR